MLASAFLLAFLAFALPTPTFAATDCNNADVPAAQCNALVDLYNATEGANWTTKTNWLDDNTVCDWFGVQCEDLGDGDTVVSLNLFENDLDGTLPASLADLTDLKFLNMRENQIDPPLPNLGALSELISIDFSHNPLSGPFPSWINATNFPNLSQLDFNNSLINGAFPDLTGLPLTYLNLGYNFFTSNVASIPAAIYNNPTLENVALQRVGFSGELPTFASPNLTQLSLDYNFLTGTIPTSYNGTTYPNMEIFTVYANSLEGDVPSEIATMTTLTYLNLGANKFTSLPTSLTNLTNIPDPNPYPLLWIEYNALPVSGINAGLQTYLNAKAPNWQNLQTVPPTNVTATAIDGDSITVSWTPIAFTDGDGYYQVGVSTTPGGEYSFTNQTPNKSVSSLTINGLSPNTTYYFVVRTFTQGILLWYPNTTSANSAEASATTTGGGSVDPTTPPSKPKLVSPIDGVIVSGDATPAFTWDANPASEQVTQYRVMVFNAANLPVVNMLADADAVCVGASCTLDIGLLTAGPIELGKGAYTWQVRAVNAIGITKSRKQNFFLEFPGKVTLVSPINDMVVNDVSPVVTWDRTQVAAAEYRVKIVSKTVPGLTYNTGWLPSGEINCSLNLCDLDLETLATPIKLKNGAYTWRVEGRNTEVAAGKSKSAAGRFSVDAPGKVTLLSPEQNDVVTTTSPIFVFSSIPGAEYRLTIVKKSNGKVYKTPWLTAELINCAEETCTLESGALPTPIVLKKGGHKWRIETRNQAVAPNKSKTAYSSFKVKPS